MPFSSQRSKTSTPNTENSLESGQSIVIVALAFIGLMAFVGLAIDVAFFYVRAAQFSAAIDAATTAGVIELRQNANEEAAYLRSAQFLNLNGWPTSTAVMTDTGYSLSTMGGPQFTLTVTWPIATNFMQLLGFGAIDVTRSATAALVARPEVYTPTSFEWGVVRKANQFAFGPDHCTRHGDPVAPLWADNSVENPYYRIPEANGVHQYRVRVGQRYLDRYGDSVLIELFDPDTYNSFASEATIVHSDIYQEEDGGPASSTASCAVPTAGASCVLQTNEITSTASEQAGEQLRASPYHNPFWFVRVDEGWSTTQSCPAGPDQVNAVSAVQTRFELYYFDMSSGIPIRTPLAQYTTHPLDATQTDLQWVAPGAGSFAGAHSENFGSFLVDVGNIPTDALGFRHVYLDVKTLSGYSKNVFDVWARPPDGDYDGTVWQLDSDVNNRNLQILNTVNELRTSQFDIVDLDVFALGRMPLNAYPPQDWGPIRLALVPIDQDLQVSAAYANIFDYDNSGQTVNFSVYLSSGFGEPATYDYGDRTIACDDGACDNSWASMTVSEDLDFGILFAAYPTGADATMLDYSGQPEAHLWSVILTTGVPVLTR